MDRPTYFKGEEIRMNSKTVSAVLSVVTIVLVLAAAFMYLSYGDLAKSMFRIKSKFHTHIQLDS